MKTLKLTLSGCAVLTLATLPVLATCGFCAEEVTLSEPLAKCFLEQLDDELAPAKDKSEVHLIDLSSCLLTRSATALPDVPTDGKKPVPLDEAFLIPAPALVCLADAVQNAKFKKGAVLTFEVRIDCEN